MMKKWIDWLPLAVTMVLMYWARVTNLGVTDYNLFLVLLIGWCLVMLLFYRNQEKGRRGKTMEEVDSESE